MRIAIVGSAGVGKTTLATTLSSHLELPLSPDPVRPLLGELNLPAPNRQTDADRLALCDAVLNRRMAFESSHDAFVADRAALDTAVYWLRWCPARAFPSETAALLARARQHMARYTHVLLLPWGALPLEDDRVRTPDPWYQYGMHALTRGVLADWGVPYVEVSRELRSVEARVATCMEIVAA